MKPVQVFQWIIAGIAGISLIHIGFESVEIILSKEPDPATHIISNLDQFKEEVSLPDNIGLILFHPDSSRPDPFHLMTAQYALAPTLLEYGTSRDTLLIHVSDPSSSFLKKYKKLWTSDNQQWILATKNGDN